MALHYGYPVLYEPSYLCVCNVVDLTISDLNLSALERGVAGIGRIEDLLKLFKCLSGSLDEEEEDKGKLNTDPANVHQVQLPANLLHTDGNTVCVDDHGDVEEEEVGSRTLRTGPVLKTLDSVQSLEWCPTPSEDDTEAVD